MKRSSKLKRMLMVGGIIGLLTVPLTVSFIPMVNGDDWVDQPDPHLSATTSYPDVINASRDYKNMRVTIQREDDTYTGVGSVTIQLATETGEKLEQIGYQSEDVNYETNLEDGTERLVGINTYDWELSGYEGNYTLRILARVYHQGDYGYYTSETVVVDYTPVKIIEGEVEGETPGFGVLPLLGAVIIASLLLTRRYNKLQ